MATTKDLRSKPYAKHVMVYFKRLVERVAKNASPFPGSSILLSLACTMLTLQVINLWKWLITFWTSFLKLSPFADIIKLLNKATIYF